jgi:hypothetical protein
MERQFYFIGIAFFGMINGMFHPLRVESFIATSYFMSLPLFGSQGLIFYFSSLMLATGTVILAGIPAALYERYRGLKDSDVVALWIWLAGTALLALPAMSSFMELGL